MKTCGCILPSINPRACETCASNSAVDSLPHSHACAECARRGEIIKALQAKIDALMLEYCPEEMSGHQMREWAQHQRAKEIQRG